MTGPLLIVDDEPANLALLRQILSPEYALVFARSGAEALAVAAKHHPALVLLDIEMPDMDGYTVCRRLKADPHTESIPVIFVTSLAEVGDEAAGFEAGAVDYLVKPVSSPVVRARVRTHLSLVSTKQLAQSYNDAIYMLGEASEFKDADTGTHIWRMAAYSSALAAASGWTPEACRQLELAAPMHDIGKLGIPDAILRKPGKLDDAEWAVMQTHSTLGYKILSKSAAPLLQMAATIAHCHHEQWGGGGYPRGLAGEAIPEMARIVAIADVFDALCTPRPYKDAWPLDQVLDTVRSSAGAHFEPRLVDHFFRILPQILEIKEAWSAREKGQQLLSKE
ncbi:MAG: response regulator [Rhodoferax sp.]|nr:HD domain-containing phosphohydrolase [Rhodoferax sp.]MDP3650323.1 response regulator [Rhodoferax sp.]